MHLCVFVLPYRCDSISNSERSFEQSSSEYTEDVFSPTPRIDSSPSPFLLAGVSEPPFSAPCGPLSLSSSLSSCLSSPISLRRPPDIFRFDRPFCVTSDPQTPPPLPPKPTHLSDPHSNEETGRNQTQPVLLPRRTSLSGIDHFRRGKHTHKYTQQIVSMTHPPPPFFSLKHLQKKYYIFYYYNVFFFSSRLRQCWKKLEQTSEPQPGKEIFKYDIVK